MVIFLQIIIIGLAFLGLIIMLKEISNIYGLKDKIKGRLYILCVPQTENMEELCVEVLNRYRRMGLGEDILICGENLSEEDKKIGRLYESADKGIYFIEPDDLPKIVK